MLSPPLLDSLQRIGFQRKFIKRNYTQTSRDIITYIQSLKVDQNNVEPRAADSGGSSRVLFSASGSPCYSDETNIPGVKFEQIMTDIVRIIKSLDTEDLNRAISALQSVVCLAFGFTPEIAKSFLQQLKQAVIFNQNYRSTYLNYIINNAGFLEDDQLT